MDDQMNGKTHQVALSVGRPASLQCELRSQAEGKVLCFTTSLFHSKAPEYRWTIPLLKIECICPDLTPNLSQT